MNAKNFLALVVAVALGLAATWVGRNLVLGSRAAAGARPQVARVAFAKADLEPGRLIGPGDVALADAPASSVTKAMFTDAKSLVGRAVITPVVKGQTMFEGLLAPAGAEGGLPALVPVGMRAVSVEVNESSAVAGLLIPGCRVDVIATLRPDGGAQVARTIVENVRVQAVNRRMAQGKGEDAGSAAIKTVTLIVSPKDAETIELASHGGKLRLVLRGTSDNAPTASVGVSYDQLTGRFASVATPWSSPAPELKQEASGFGRFLSAMLGASGAAHDAPGSDESATLPLGPHSTRYSVRLIRGSEEETIHYELQAAQQDRAGWSVSRNHGAAGAAPSDPFSPTK
jgi:pilus assembly protein CpaB